MFVVHGAFIWNSVLSITQLFNIYICLRYKTIEILLCMICERENVEKLIWLPPRCGMCQINVLQLRLISPNKLTRSSLPLPRYGWGLRYLHSSRCLVWIVYGLTKTNFFMFFNATCPIHLLPTDCYL